MFSRIIAYCLLSAAESVLVEREQSSVRWSSLHESDGAPWTRVQIAPKRLPAEFLEPHHEDEIQSALLNGRAGEPRGGCQIGTPKPPRFHPKHVPYTAQHAEKQRSGDRVLALLTVDPEVIRRCEGFTLYGDYAWCAKAMPKLRQGAVHQGFGFTEVGNINISGQREGAEFLALSYGIRDRDMWSELLSNRYRIPSEVFDCFTTLDSGPMGSKDLTNPSMGEKLCPPWTIKPCYDAPYKVHRTCLGNASFVLHLDRDLQFVSLGSSLVGREPLSVYLKMDIEGSEWDVLDELLSNEEDCKKIRTLDMEVHFNRYFDGRHYLGPAMMEHKIEILERLTERFRVVGSTVQPLHAIRKLQMDTELEKNPRKTWSEPLIYPAAGLEMEQFSLSLLNPDLFA